MKEASKLNIIGSFAAIYLIWGSTYLGIRIAVETIPPFALAAVRFLSAGSILYVIARLFGAPSPQWVQWRSAAVLGFFLTVVGNGFVAWAEQRVPSAMAALIIPLVPMWLVLFEWFGGDAAGIRRRPATQKLIGLACGFAGVVLLSADGLEAAGNLSRFSDMFALFLATLGWAVGTTYGKTAPQVQSVPLRTGMYMLAGGMFLAAFSTVSGEVATINLSRITAQSWYALAYLTVFGSIVAFSAYSYLIPRVPHSALGTYAFVNPLVALVIGSYWYNERLEAMGWFGAGGILLGVLMLVTCREPSSQTDRQQGKPKTSNACREQLIVSKVSDRSPESIYRDATKEALGSLSKE